MKTENKLVNVVLLVLVEGEVKHEYLPLRLLLLRHEHCELYMDLEKKLKKKERMKMRVCGV